MKLQSPVSLQEAASFLGVDFVGPEDHTISGINEIHRVESGDLVFVDHPKYYDKALNSEATTILIDKEVDCPEGKGLLISPQPFDDYNKLTRHFRPFRGWSEKSKPIIGENCVIHPSSYIGQRVQIGSDCVIHAGVVLNDDTRIGDRVVVHANSVLGADAFYYKKTNDGYVRMHSCGWVDIESDVEIGALCTIDKGVSADTRIGMGSKLDNQVHIGHDSIVGQHCLIAAQAGIAGCVVVKDHVTIWGQVGIASGVTIEEKSTILAQSGIMNTVHQGTTVFGTPAGESRQKFKEMAYIRKIPELMDKLR